MKNIFCILFLGTFLQINLANAAIVSCVRQENPCDDQGGHYYCEVFAWGNAKFCSLTDQSSRRGRSSSFGTTANLAGTANDYNQCMAECMARPKADYAKCDIYYCHAW